MESHAEKAGNSQILDGELRSDDSALSVGMDSQCNSGTVFMDVSISRSAQAQSKDVVGLPVISGSCRYHSRISLFLAEKKNS